MTIHATELALLGLWLLLPPLGLGLALLAALHGRLGRRIGLHPWRAGLLLVALGIAIAVAFVLIGPAWLARYLAVRDVAILGWRTLWAPFAFGSVAVAFPLAVWLGRGP